MVVRLQIFLARIGVWFAVRAARSTLVRYQVLQQYRLKLRASDQDVLDCPLDVMLGNQQYLATFFDARALGFRVRLEGPGDGSVQ